MPPKHSHYLKTLGLAGVMPLMLGAGTMGLAWGAGAGGIGLAMLALWILLPFGLISSGAILGAWLVHTLTVPQLKQQGVDPTPTSAPAPGVVAPINSIIEPQTQSEPVPLPASRSVRLMPTLFLAVLASAAGFGAIKLLVYHVVFNYRTDSLIQLGSVAAIGIGGAFLISVLCCNIYWQYKRAKRIQVNVLSAIITPIIVFGALWLLFPVHNASGLEAQLRNLGYTMHIPNASSEIQLLPHALNWGSCSTGNKHSVAHPKGLMYMCDIEPNEKIIGTALTLPTVKSDDIAFTLHEMKQTPLSISNDRTVHMCTTLRRLNDRQKCYPAFSTDGITVYKVDISPEDVVSGASRNNIYPYQTYAFEKSGTYMLLNVTSDAEDISAANILSQDQIANLIHNLQPISKEELLNNYTFY